MRARASCGLLVIACCAVATGLVGCGLFKPTEPEPPSGDVLIPDYTSPEATLETMAQSIEAKGGAGLSAYVDALASLSVDGADFRAFHLPEAIQAHENGGGTVPPDWTRTLEQDFYSGFATHLAGEYFMLWNPDERNDGNEFIDFNADTAALYREYTVITAQQDGSTVDVARGVAYLRLVRGASGRWVVVLWKDILGDPGDDINETFGALRLRLQ